MLLHLYNLVFLEDDRPFTTAPARCPTKTTTVESNDAPTCDQKKVSSTPSETAFPYLAYGLRNAPTIPLSRFHPYDFICCACSTNRSKERKLM